MPTTRSRSGASSSSSLTPPSSSPIAGSSGVTPCIAAYFLAPPTEPPPEQKGDGSRPPRLLLAEEVPPHVRYTLVEGGYPVGPPRLSLLFELHNETANVWSHIVACCWAVQRLHACVAHPTAGFVPRFYIGIFLLTQVFGFCASATAHLLGGGAVISPRRSVLVWRVDLVGIAINIAGSYCPGIRWGFRCKPLWQKAYGLIVGTACALSAVLASAPPRSKANAWFVHTMAFTAGFGLVPLAHWCTFAPTEERQQMLPSGLAMLGSYGFGFLFWKFAFVERLALHLGRPGLFDYTPSHFVWHLAVFFGAVCWEAGSWRHILDTDPLWDCDSCPAGQG